MLLKFADVVWEGAAFEIELSGAMSEFGKYS
jgi:hypothetical protein